MSAEKKFNYSYSSTEKKELERIRKKYEPKRSEKTTLEHIKKLDESVTKAGTVTSIIVGIIGTLLLGTGMSCVLVWGNELFSIGVLIGIAGLIILSAAYPVYRSVTEKRRKEVAEEILRLTDEIL